MPTNNSSTLWLIPGEVSMYLQPNFVASDFPAEIKIHKAEINDSHLDFFFLCFVSHDLRDQHIYGSNHKSFQ